MRHMPGSDMLACRFAMFLLIIKEYVSSKRFQEFPLIFATKK